MLLCLHQGRDILNQAFPFTAKPGGGIGFDVGIYSIAALLSILGPVKEVSGIVQIRKPAERS
jgi:predicted dehydrogenase